MDKGLRLKWVSRLMRSKSFIVITDHGAVVALKGLDPRKVSDINILNQQAASLESFVYQLGEVLLEHEKAVKRLQKERAPKKATKTTKKEKKINA